MWWHLLDDGDVKNTNQGETNCWSSQPEITPLRGTGGDAPYPQGFALPRENPITYALSSVAYPFNYELPQVVNTLGLVMREPNTSTDLVDPLAVPDLDELAEKEKSLQDKVLEKYELLEERIRAMEGINILESLDVTKLSLVLGLVIPQSSRL